MGDAYVDGVFWERFEFTLEKHQIKLYNLKGEVNK